MTSSEFQKWFDHFAAAFPAVQDFVRKGDPPGTPVNKVGKATLTLWFEVLKKRELGDCLQITNDLFEGTKPIPWLDKGFHDWSAVPRCISRMCAELKPIEPEWKKHTVRNNAKIGIIDSDKSMAAAFKHCREEILDNGGSMDDVRSYLDELYGPETRASDKGNYEPSFQNYNESESF